MQKVYHISCPVYRKRDRELKCEVLFKRDSNEHAISTSRDQFYYFNSFYRNYWTVNFNSKFIGEEKKHTNLLTLENVAHILCKGSWKLDCVMNALAFSLPFFHCSWWIWIHLWRKHEHHLCCAILYDPIGSLT